MEGGLERNHWVGHRGEALTSHNIPEVDEAVSPSSGQEAAVGAKMSSIHLREVGILWGKEKIGVPGPCHTSLFVHAQLKGSLSLCLCTQEGFVTSACSRLQPCYSQLALWSPSLLSLPLQSTPPL